MVPCISFKKEMEAKKTVLGFPLYCLSVRPPIPEGSIKRNASKLTSPHTIVCAGGGGGGASVGVQNALVFFKISPCNSNSNNNSNNDDYRLEEWFRHTIEEETIPASFAIDPETNEEFLVALSAEKRCKTLNFADGGKAVTTDEKVTIVESNEDEDVGQDYVGFMTGNKVVTGGGDGMIRIWNWNNFTLESAFKFLNESSSNLNKDSDIDDEVLLNSVEIHGTDIVYKKKYF